LSHIGYGGLVRVIVAAVFLHVAPSVQVLLARAVDGCTLRHHQVLPITSYSV